MVNGEFRPGEEGEEGGEGKEGEGGERTCCQIWCMCATFENKDLLPVLS